VRYRWFLFCAVAFVAYLFFSSTDTKTEIEKRYFDIVSRVEFEDNTAPLDLIFKARSIENFLDDEVELTFVRDEDIFERVSSPRALTDRLLAINQGYRNLSIESRSVEVLIHSDTSAALKAQLTVRARQKEGITRVVEIYQLELDYTKIDKEWLISKINLHQLTSSTS